MDLPPLDGICRRHDIVLLVQFGSTVDGRVHPASDLDLSALSRKTPSISDYLALLADLEGVLPGREIDLSFLNTADPLFLHKILERPRLLYGPPDRFAELKLYAFKRYQDHQRFLALERQYVEDTLQRLVTR